MGRYVDIACMDATQFCSTLSDGSVDLFICDPPFGIGEETFTGASNKEPTNKDVIPGYVPAPTNYTYYEFCITWVREMYRSLKMGGTAYIVCGWSYPLAHLMLACEDTGFLLLNHIVWHYPNKVLPTTKKFASSHYHILRLGKGKTGYTFNELSSDDLEAIGTKVPIDSNATVAYVDKMDTWTIPKQSYKGTRNLNALPYALVRKMILYSSNVGDVVCDLFCGNFTTAYVAMEENRNFTGCELNRNAYDHHIRGIEDTIQYRQSGYILTHD